MLSFFLTVLKLLRTAFNAASDSEFRALAFITFALLLTGSVFYARVEGWGIIDALYFCVMTMTTIGYGDLTPANNLYKMFAVVYAFLSIGVFVSLVAKLALAMRKRYAAHHHRLDGHHPRT